MKFRTLAALPVALVIVAGCHKKVRTAKPPTIGGAETGIASWYGYPYHGRRAASGEIYDMEQMTAAHRTLPFNTWVRVRNLSNEKTVDVRITDRGPFIEKRIIDLSRAAARAIDMIGPGTTLVQLTIIEPPEPAQLPPQDLYAVQVGAFQDHGRAERIRADMEARYGSARIVERPATPTLWRVLVGQENSVDSAGALASRIQSEGTTCFVVRLDTPITP